MRDLLRSLTWRRRARPAHRRTDSPTWLPDVQPSGAYPALRPWQVRSRTFTIRRRGADPVEVAAYLDRVAGELAAAQVALAASRQEAARVRDALRRWQSQQVPGVAGPV
ncbi:DivIVA domain-containing protein [Micromonospora sp. WMMA1923]|uniref:DivIVA domain-containing protein n=1 Tax=Micromonospora sp. WMMA1923 TaxID=3404125 RepID=UPI003B93FBB4